MSVLVTNNANTHAPETWAAATASTIFDAGADVAAYKRIPAMKFQASLAELLVAHHAAVQADEQAALNASDARFAVEHDVSRYLGNAEAAIQALAAGTLWAGTFADPEMVKSVRGVLASHFATAQHIQRQAHARANPGNAAGQTFLAQVHGGSN